MRQTIITYPAIIPHSTSRQCNLMGNTSRGFWERFSHLINAGIRMVEPLWKTARKFLKKQKIWVGPKKKNQTYHMTQQFYSWVYTRREQKHTNLKNTCALIFIAALFTIAKIWKQPKCPSTDECIRCETHSLTLTHTHTHTHTQWNPS